MGSIALSTFLILVMLSSSGNTLYGAEKFVGNEITVAEAVISAQEAAALVKARTGGRILSVEAIDADGGIIYRVKVLTPDGEIRVFNVDAATGAM